MDKLAGLAGKMPNLSKMSNLSKMPKLPANLSKMPNLSKLKNKLGNLNPGDPTPGLSGNNPSNPGDPQSPPSPSAPPANANATPSATKNAEVKAVVQAANGIVNSKSANNAINVENLLKNPKVKKAAFELAEELRKRPQAGGRKTRKVNRKRRASRSLRR